MTILARYLSIAVMATLVSLSAISARAQIYDFSVTFSGLDNVGGAGSLTALLEFDNNSLIGVESLSISSGGINRTIVSAPTFSGALGGGSEGSTLSDLSIAFQISFGAEVSTIFLDYPEDDRGQFPVVPNALQLESIIVGSSEGDTSWRTSYTLGGATVDSTTGEPNQAPVAVPEINGGRAVLMAFILATLGLAMSVRRRRAEPPQTVATFA